MSPRASFRLLAILLILPVLTGCAAGMGNFGPGAAGAARGHGAYDTVDRHWDEFRKKWVVDKVHHNPSAQTAWRGAAAIGLALGQSKVTATGFRDTTLERTKYIHGDVVLNLTGDRFSVGATMGHLTMEFPGEIESFRYSGYLFGPSVFMKLFRYASVDASAAHIFGKLEDRNSHYYTPYYNFLGPELSLPGTRLQGDLNVFLLRSERADLCVRLGYQRTTIGPKEVFTRSREIHSEGPLAEILITGF